MSCLSWSSRTNGLCITLCDKAFSGAGWLSIVSRFALFFMQNFAAFAVLSGMLTVLGWSYVTQPVPQVDLQAYRKCVSFHPQKFCALYHAPSKLEATVKK
jgi:hypothetical protein